MEGRPGLSGLARITQDENGVVLHSNVPEVRAEQSAVERQRTKQPVAQVEHVHPLVHQLAASGDFGTHAPLALVAESSPVPVATANEHDLAVRSGERFLGGA